MVLTLIGYARYSTEKRDLAAQRGTDQALAAVRNDDTLVVLKLDRLPRSVPDARAIGDCLTECGVKLQLGANLGRHGCRSRQGETATRKAKAF